MDLPLPPLPPINEDTVGSVNVAVECFDLDDSASAIAVSVADYFFRSAFSESVDRKIDFSVKEAPMTMEKIPVSHPQVHLHRIKWACCWMA